ncbi:hypothetical protein D1007_45674 [Hordeum vulgare]|nr:hypothetical protein D1007_45674 [Hordeum vulgare]
MHASPDAAAMLGHLTDCGYDYGLHLLYTGRQPESDATVALLGLFPSRVGDFWVGFYAHLFTANRAAKDTESHFLLLGFPYDKNCNAGGSSNGNITGDKLVHQSPTRCSLPQSAMDDKSGLRLRNNCLLPRNATSTVKLPSIFSYVVEIPSNGKAMVSA